MAKSTAEGVMPIIGTVAGGIVGSIIPGLGTAIGAAAGNLAGQQLGQSITTGNFPGINQAGPGGLPSLFSMFGGSGMGNPFGGKSGGGSSGGGGTVNISPGAFTDLSPLAVGETQLANQATAISNAELGQAQPLLGAGMGEFLAGATGQLTPAQQAASDFELGQANTRTNTTFGNLGMGPGTGQTADLNANLLGNEALQAQLEQMSQTEGINAMRTGLGFEAGASGDIGTAGSLLGTAGNILKGTNSDFLNALKSAISGTGSLLGGASDLLNTGKGSAAPGTSGGFNNGADLVNPVTGEVTVPPIPPAALDAIGGSTALDAIGGSTALGTALAGAGDAAAGTSALDAVGKALPALAAA